MAGWKQRGDDFEVGVEIEPYILHDGSAKPSAGRIARFVHTKLGTISPRAYVPQQKHILSAHRTDFCFTLTADHDKNVELLRCSYTPARLGMNA